MLNVDKHMYSLFNYVPPICDTVVSPNVITLCNLGMVYQIHQSLRTKHIGHLVVYVFCSHLLHCFGGYVARKCNKTSEFGKWLELVVGTFKVCVLIHGYLRYYIKLSDASSKQYATVLATVATLLKLPVAVHDNATILQLVTVCLLHAYAR